MIPWLYKWLPILCGCHCREDRSFFWRGRKFPVCARCTGELAGIVLLLLSGWFWLPDWGLGAVLLLPMLADGFLQLLTRYESTNFRRVVTGTLFGYGLAALYLKSHIAVFWFGFRLVK